MASGAQVASDADRFGHALAKEPQPERTGSDDKCFSDPNNNDHDPSYTANNNQTMSSGNYANGIPHESCVDGAANDTTSSDGHACKADASDHTSDVPQTVFRFLDLPPEVQSHTMNFLDLRDICHIRATCHKLRELPTIQQQRKALAAHEENFGKAWGLLSTFVNQEVMEVKHRDPDTPDSFWLFKLPDLLSRIYLELSETVFSKTGLYQKWLAVATEQGLSNFYASFAADTPAYIGKLHCYECLEVKMADKFDITEAAPEFWPCINYAYNGNGFYMFHDLKLTKSDAMATRTCITCKLNSPEGPTKGYGWIRNYKFQWYVQCSRCQNNDFVDDNAQTRLYRDSYTFDNHSKWNSVMPLRVDTWNRQAGLTPAQAMSDDFDWGRLLQGELCTTCFRKENEEWFAYKTQLLAKIKEQQKYLQWMIDLDRGRDVGSAPVVDVVGNWP